MADKSKKTLHLELNLKICAHGKSCSTIRGNIMHARTYRLHLEVDERGEIDASRLSVDGERHPEVGALTVADDVLRIVEV